MNIFNIIITKEDILVMSMYKYAKQSYKTVIILSTTGGCLIGSMNGKLIADEITFQKKNRSYYETIEECSCYSTIVFSYSIIGIIGGTFIGITSPALFPYLTYDFMKTKMKHSENEN